MAVFQREEKKGVAHMDSPEQDGGQETGTIPLTGNSPLGEGLSNPPVGFSSEVRRKDHSMPLSHRP